MRRAGCLGVEVGPEVVLQILGDLKKHHAAQLRLLPSFAPQLVVVDALHQLWVERWAILFGGQRCCRPVLRSDLAERVCINLIDGELRAHGPVGGLRLLRPWRSILHLRPWPPALRTAPATPSTPAILQPSTRSDVAAATSAPAFALAPTAAAPAAARPFRLGHAVCALAAAAFPAAVPLLHATRSHAMSWAQQGVSERIVQCLIESK
mmetsp:Transcript_6222/g.17866  ORF Transcript_6222/g.17866 Transcript_6222/m.17866 type:complete len:208 (+) Transcript_6222:4044-4667(+)